MAILKFVLLSLISLCSFVVRAEGPGSEESQRSVFTVDTLLLRKIPVGCFVDSLFLDKSERKLYAFADKHPVKAYLVGLGKFPSGAKQVEGDYKTPEGLYYIDSKNPNSQYYKNLGISYPSALDVKRAASLGRRPGGNIKIHGLPPGVDQNQYVRCDWTWGCVALTNSEIDELYAHTRTGIPICIVP